MAFINIYFLCNIMHFVYLTPIFFFKCKTALWIKDIDRKGIYFFSTYIVYIVKYSKAYAFIVYLCKNNQQEANLRTFCLRTRFIHSLLLETCATWKNHAEQKLRRLSFPYICKKRYNCEKSTAVVKERIYTYGINNFSTAMFIFTSI